MFTPVHTTIGALLLFSSSFGLLVHNGRIFGISSILRSCLLLRPGSVKDDHNLPILAGLVSSPLLVALVVPSLLPLYRTELFSTTTTAVKVASPWVSAVATLGLGLLTGWGTKVLKSSLHCVLRSSLD